MGPGVTPILFWTSPALASFDPQLEATANAEQAQLFTNAKCRAK
jgi:hypothetical protein